METEIVELVSKKQAKLVSNKHIGKTSYIIYADNDQQIRDFLKKKIEEN